MEGSERNMDLEYSDEDIERPCIFVLFCPWKILEDGTMIKYIDFDALRTHLFSSSLCFSFFCIILQKFKLNPTYASYLILKQAAPEVKPHILCALAYGENRDTMGNIAGIDYSPVRRIFGQHAKLGSYLRRQ